MQEYDYPTLASAGRRRANRRLFTALSLLCGTTLLMLTCYLVSSCDTQPARPAIVINVEQQPQLDIPAPPPPIEIEQTGTQPAPMQTTEPTGTQPPPPQPIEQSAAQPPILQSTDQNQAEEHKSADLYIK